MFRWSRRMFDLLFQSPSSTIKSDANFTYSYSKYMNQLEELRKKNKKRIISKAIKNTIWSEEYKEQSEQLIELESLEEHSYYSVPSEITPHHEQTFLVVTIKDDRIYIPEEKKNDDTERVVVQKFSTREEYLTYFRSKEFLSVYNERDYYFSPIGNGTILFKRSQFKNNYTDPKALKFINDHRISQKTIVKAMAYYMGFFLIPHFFSWIELVSIPTISNPYTFLIETFNFVYGFLMFFPVLAVWLDINYTITSTLKEVIILFQDTKEKLQKFTEKEISNYDPSKQVKINISNKRFFLLDHNMIKDWFKQANYLQKTMIAKTNLLKSNFVVSNNVTIISNESNSLHLC